MLQELFRVGYVEEGHNCEGLALRLLAMRTTNRELVEVRLKKLSECILRASLRNVANENLHSGWMRSARGLWCWIWDEGFRCQRENRRRCLVVRRLRIRVSDRYGEDSSSTVGDGSMKHEGKSFDEAANWTNVKSRASELLHGHNDSPRTHETHPYLRWVSVGTYWVKIEVYILRYNNFDC